MDSCFFSYRRQRKRSYTILIFFLVNQVPGTEGRAGMAAIHDPDEIVDLEKLALGLKAKLPAFARPLFVRLVDHFDITGRVDDCFNWLLGKEYNGMDHF